jgi:hypothetical protein
MVYTKLCMSNQINIGCLGSEFENFIKFEKVINSYNIDSECLVCALKQFDCSSDLLLNNSPISKKTFISIFCNEITHLPIQCKKCNIEMKSHFQFKLDPLWLIFEAFNIKIDSVSEKLTINNSKVYKLLLCTIYIADNKHFKSIFYNESNYYICDDLSSTINKVENFEELKTYECSMIMYCLSEELN